MMQQTVQQTTKQNGEPTAAPEEHVGPYDVICGRDRLAFNNVGNRRMRVIVSIYLTQYLEAKSRSEKSILIQNVAKTIHQGGGRFLKWCDKLNGYEVLEEKQVHSKCAHAFRDMVSARKQSSKTFDPAKPRKSRTLVPFHYDAAESKPSLQITEHDLSSLSTSDDKISTRDVHYDDPAEPKQQKTAPDLSSLSTTDDEISTRDDLLAMFDDDEEDLRQIFLDLLDGEDKMGAVA